ncbi:MAG TPA: phosphatidate cytidylyltransferase [Xanthobacteraceae bacterium]|nr:phosphatidate cytidylyltransferase [Xanthobacteraceae bacterium]
MPATADQPSGGTGPEPAGSNLVLRVVSALVLAPVALVAAYLGGWAFFMFWLMAAIGVLWEWNGLVAKAAAWRISLASGLALVLGSVLVLFESAGLGLLLVLGGVAMAALSAPGDRRVWAATGVIYAAALVLSPVVLRADATYGLAAIALLFAVVWSTDIAAYFGGRLLGGPKLWPRVSPKKTWSGALVGTAVAVAAGVAVGHAAGADNLVLLGAVCLLLSAVSQAGDLFESAIKRRFEAKDSGQLIPGHGGLMDRLDGFVAAAFVGVLIGLSRGGWEAPSRGLMIW